MIKLSILIPTYERRVKLNEQLKFLEREVSEFNKYCEIIVCDNSKSPVRLETTNPHVRYYWNEGNLGLAGSVSKLIQLSNGVYSWLLSDDDEVKPGSVKLLIDVIDRMMASDANDLIVLECSASYQDKLFKDRVYFDGLCKDVLPRDEFLTQYWESLFFISIVVYKTRMAKKQLLSLGGLNRVYPQTHLSWALLLDGKYTCVSVVGKPCVVDRYGVKNYNPSDINHVPVVSLANLISLIYVELTKASIPNYIVLPIACKLKKLLICNTFEYGLKSVIAINLWPVHRERYIKDYISVLKYRFGARFRILVILIIILLNAPRFAVMVLKLVSKPGGRFDPATIESSVLNLTGSCIETNVEKTAY